MAPIRIMLADDHSVVRAGLKALIDAQADMHVICEAENGADVLADVAGAEVDLVVMDLSMPRLNGLETTQYIREHHPQIHVLVLSVHDEATYLRQALAAGARGYMLKRSAAEVLVTGIRKVASGDVYLDPALSAAVVQGMAKSTGSVTGSPDALSERERTVLQLIAHGYSNKEIASQLDLSVKTVETYKARAMEKLNLNSRVDLIRYATAQGWLGDL